MDALAFGPIMAIVLYLPHAMRMEKSTGCQTSRTRYGLKTSENAGSETSHDETLWLRGVATCLSRSEVLLSRWMPRSEAAPHLGGLP